MIAVDPLRPYLKRSWIKGLKPKEARRKLFSEIETWAAGIKTIPLFDEVKLEEWAETAQVARGSEHYSKHIWFLLRTHYNLYCLATHRKTIEELAVGAYAYCSLPSLSSFPSPFSKCIDEETRKKRSKLVASRNRAFADFRRLLRLSKVFLLAEWVHEMIERDIANKFVPGKEEEKAERKRIANQSGRVKPDQEFFNVLSNALKNDIMVDTSRPAIEWSLVILLWFLGGKDYSTRREFLYALRQNDIVPDYVTETSLNAELKRFGLTTTYL